MERNLARLRAARLHPHPRIERADKFQSRMQSAKELAPRNPRVLTLTRMQYSAIVGNTGNRKSLVYAEFANPCNAQQLLTAHSQLGQRFESARRLFFFPANLTKR